MRCLQIVYTRAERASKKSACGGLFRRVAPLPSRPPSEDSRAGSGVRNVCAQRRKLPARPAKPGDTNALWRAAALQTSDGWCGREAPGWRARRCGEPRFLCPLDTRNACAQRNRGRPALMARAVGAGTRLPRRLSDHRECEFSKPLTGGAGGRLRDGERGGAASRVSCARRALETLARSGTGADPHPWRGGSERSHARALETPPNANRRPPPPWGRAPRVIASLILNFSTRPDPVAHHPRPARTAPPKAAPVQAAAAPPAATSPAASALAAHRAPSAPGASRSHPQASSQLLPQPAQNFAPGSALRPHPGQKRSAACRRARRTRGRTGCPPAAPRRTRSTRPQRQPHRPQHQPHQRHQPQHQPRPQRQPRQRQQQRQPRRPQHQPHQRHQPRRSGSARTSAPWPRPRPCPRPRRPCRRGWTRPRAWPRRPGTARSGSDRPPRPSRCGGRWPFRPLRAG